MVVLPRIQYKGTGHLRKYKVMLSGFLALFQSTTAYKIYSELGPSINGLVTDGNTKLCCRGFILALFQSTTANKIDSGHTRDYNRLLRYGKLKYVEFQ